MKLILATTNPGKLQDMKTVLADLPFTILTPHDLGETLDVHESGSSFAENAAIKAKAYAAHFGLPALADDGGLEIDALNGEPGVLSHRWPGYYASDDELIGYTLGRMNGIGAERRGAQLHMVVALATSPQNVVFEEGILRGMITETPTTTRQQGYPYRALLFLPEAGKCYSELTEEEHARINHRFKTLQRFKNKIVEALNHA